MKTNRKQIIICLFCVAVMNFSCKKNTNSSTETEVKPTEILEEPNNIKEEPINTDFVAQSVNDELAIKIKDFITTKYLSEADLNSINEDQRKFQLYQIDLNNDGNNEVFVNFITSYFCGTGGCSIVLLDDQLNPITNFTVTRTPLYIEKELKNNWRILLTRSRGELKELVYSNGSYPTNPSLVEKAPYDAPSGHAEIMFDDNYSKAKTYEF